ncbi:MAG: GGDEF domain-containing protein [Patescibacteria group bacterium]|jgi:diguanylate cyclase (GGDEF)-like protein
MLYVSLALIIAALASWIIRLIFANARLRRKSAYDWLTGLLSKPGIIEIGQRIVSSSVRYSESDPPVVVMLADLDGFKRLNDKCGHHAGDEMLRSVAGNVFGHLRESDGVGRVGGDEFVLVARGDALSLAQKIESSMNAINTWGAGRGFPEVGMSIGIAVLNHEKVGLFCFATGRSWKALRPLGEIGVYHSKHRKVFGKFVAGASRTKLLESHLNKVRELATHPVTFDGMTAAADAAMYSAKTGER